MADQVAVLQELVSRQTAANGHAFRIISVTSGKGGVGKTNFTVNLAIALTELGFRTIVLDGDIGMANVNVACGINPRFTIEHLLNGEKMIEEILVQGPGGIGILSGGCGIKDMATLGSRQLEHVIRNLGKLEKLSDILIIDTGAGLGSTVLNFLRASDDIILLTTKEPTALTDAYGLLKTLNLPKEIPINVVINRISGEGEAREAYQRLEIAVRKFLNGSIKMLGWVSEDSHVGRSVMQQEPLGLAYPRSQAYGCIKWIAGSITGLYLSAPRQKTGIKGFLSSLLRA